VSLVFWAVAALLWLGVALLVLAAGGAAVARRTYDRLHLVALGATVGAPLVVVALAIQSGDAASAIKLVLIAALLLGTGPATAVVTARGRSRAYPEGGRR
jgi:multisubunit Na+/H+ antiporter MnhG subunit